MKDIKYTAKIIAAMFHKSGFSRIRLSEKSIKLISGIPHMYATFVVDLQKELLLSYSLVLIEINSGFGLIPAKSLEGARSVTTKIFSDEEWGKIVNGTFEIDFKHKLEQEERE